MPIRSAALSLLLLAALIPARGDAPEGGIPLWAYPETCFAVSSAGIARLVPGGSILGHDGGATSPAGARIVSVGGPLLRGTDAATGAPLWEIELPAGSRITAGVALGEDLWLLLDAGRDVGLLLDSASGGIASEFPLPAEPAAVCFDPRSRLGYLGFSRSTTLLAFRGGTDGIETLGERSLPLPDRAAARQSVVELAFAGGPSNPTLLAGLERTGGSPRASLAAFSAAADTGVLAYRGRRRLSGRLAVRRIEPAVNGRCLVLLGRDTRSVLVSADPVSGRRTRIRGTGGRRRYLADFLPVPGGDVVLLQVVRPGWDLSDAEAVLGEIRGSAFAARDRERTSRSMPAYAPYLVGRGGRFRILPR
jgi:hypothetical protein